MIIERKIYLDKLIERKHNRLIKIVTGIRRCGKSFLLNELFVSHLLESGVDESHIIKMSMEGAPGMPLRDPSYTFQFLKEQVVDKDMHYIIIDEVQMMNDFVELLNGLLQISNVDVYVTGSNSKFLSSDIATEFRGRGDVIQMHPLRFSEFLSAYDGDRLDAWDDYFTYGGLPQLFTYSTRESKVEYLKTLFDSTYSRDIIERNGLRNEEKLNDLLNVISSGIGSFTNPTKLEKTFKSKKNESFSHTAIDNYLGCLEDAFIISRAQRYDVKGKRYIGTPYKIYFEDIGLRNARLNFRQIEENHIMENILYNELRIRGFNVDVGVVEHFEKDKNGKTVRKDYEVDFVVNRGSERYYIQSAISIDEPAKEQQEKNSLKNIKDSFKKIIIQKDYLKPKTDEDGIVRMGMMNFLLDDNILS